MPVVYPNAQAVLVNYLRPALAANADPVLTGLVIGTTVPTTHNAPGPPLLVVRRSGGPAEWPVRDRPLIDFLAWHSTEFKATAVASIVRSLIHHDLPGRVVDGHTVYRPREFSGPTPYPDPAGSAVPVVMFTAEIPIRVRSTP